MPTTVNFNFDRYKYILNQPLNSGTWANFRNTTDQTHMTLVNNDALARCERGYYWSMVRAFGRVTVSLPAGAVVTAANLYVYSGSQSFTFPIGTKSTAVGFYNTGSNITLDDYHNCMGATLENVGWWAEMSWHAFTIDPSLVTNGYMQFVFRDGAFDYPDIEPSSGAYNNYILFTQTPDIPYLEVTYVQLAVTTQACTNVLSTTATGNGTITSVVSGNATKRGICWSTAGSPTIADSKTEESPGPFGVGIFSEVMTALSPATTYYVKAYAYNAIDGYVYGNEIMLNIIPAKGAIAFGGIFSPGAFSEFSNDIMSMNIKRGRMHELDRVEAGTAVVVLDNSSGDYYRYNTASPYYASGGLRPLLRIHLSKTYGGVSYDLFDGLTESIQPGWVEDRGGMNPIVTIQCVDMFKSFTRLSIFGVNYGYDPTTTPATMGTFPSQLSGDRIVAILDEMGWPGTGLKISADRAIDGGQVEVCAHTPPTGGTNAMEHLFAIAEAESGRIFMGAEGKVYFYDRDHDIGNTVSATFSDSSGSLYVLPEFSDDDTFIYNEARIASGATNSSGSPAPTFDEQFYYDSTAMGNQGERAWVKTDSIIENTEDAFNQAWILVSRYSDSILRCMSLLVMPDADPTDLYPKVLGYELSTRIALELNSVDNPEGLGANGKQYNIEAIEHEYKADTNIWKTKWQLWDVNQYRLLSSVHHSYVQKTGTPYATLRTASTGDLATNDDVLFRVGQSYALGTNDFTIYRSYLEFSTNSTVTVYTISTGQLLLYGLGVAVPSTCNPFDLTIVSAGTTVNPVVTANYSGLAHSVSYGSVTLTTAPIGWFSIPLNSVGLTTIVSSTTRFALRASTDISGTSPNTTADCLELAEIVGEVDGYHPRLVLKLTS